MKYWVITLLLLSPAALWSQNADRAFVEKIVQEYQGHTAITYDIDYAIKYFDNEDTTRIAASVNLVRDLKDTTFGGQIYYSVNDPQYGNCSKYYNGRNLFYIDHKKKKVTNYDVEKEQTFVITGATDGEALNIKFMRPQRIELMIDTPGNTTTYRDIRIKERDYAAVKILFAAEEDITNQWIEFFIDKKTRLMDRIDYHAELKDQSQHNQWRLKNITFDKTDAQALSTTFDTATKTYAFEDFKEQTEEERAPLANGSKAPDFTLKQYPDNKEIKLSGHKGKIVILDFWYMACGPCVNAVPHLTSLQKKYKDKIVVLGLNAHDGEEKQLKKMPAFIARNNLDYTIGFIDYKTVTQYNVQLFPTLYVIAPDGKIYHSELGYSDSLEADLEKVIEELLAK